MNNARLPWIGLSLLTVFIFSLGLPGAFLLDDNINIVPAQLANFNLEELLIVSLNNTSGPLGRPLSVASFALTSYFFNLEPSAFKLINIILHLGIGICAYALIKKMLQGLNYSEACAQKIAFATSAIWCLHPIQVSTVLYSVQRMTQLSTLFMLLGLLGYSHFREKLSESCAKNFVLLCLVYTVCLACAVFSKENGVLLPLFILLIEATIWRFTATNKKSLLSFLLLFVVPPLAAASVYLYVSLDSILEHYVAYGFTLETRLLTQPSVLWFYCQLLLLPRLKSMSLFHDDYPLSTSLNESALLSIAAWIFVIAASVIAFRRWPVMLIGVMWFLFGHLLESTFLPLEMVFEHRNYFPSIGIFLIFTTGISGLFQQANINTKILRFGLISLVLTLTGLTAIRAMTWSNEALFLEVAMLEHPLSARAQGEWGNYLAMSGDIDGALAALSKTADLAPHNPGPILHQLLLHCGKENTSELLIEKGLVSVAQKPMTPYAINTLTNLSLALLANGCASLDSDTLVLLTLNAFENPLTQSRPNWASLVGITLARAYFVDKKFNKAWDTYDQAYLFYPSRLETLIEKATLQATIADFASASKTLQDIEGLTKGHFIRYDSQLSDLKRLINEPKH